MAEIKAFGKWDTEELKGNPFAMKGCLKVFLSEPAVPLILDTVNERIAFIAVRIAKSNRFMLPKANRSEAEKKRAVYYAVYTPSSEWDIIDGGYTPSVGSNAYELVSELIPPAQNDTPPPVDKASEGSDAEVLRMIITQSPDHPPYLSFPLTQRQMLEQAAHRDGMNIEEYIEAVIPPKRRQWAYGRFGIDIQAQV